MKVNRFTRRSLPAALANLDVWPEVDVTGFETAELMRFQHLRRALEAYIRGERITPILKQLDVTHEELLRAVSRCVARHDDGRIFGWRGLIRSLRVKHYERVKPLRLDGAGRNTGHSGALALCFREHPEIEEALQEFLLTCKQPDAFKISRVTQQEAHSCFLRSCESAGIPAHKWPFATTGCGKGALRNYVKRFFEQNHDAVVRAQFGSCAQTKSRTGTGVRSRLSANLPFDVVEVDEHRADFIGSIGVETASGVLWVPISRVIIITVTDRRSGTVLGYEAVFAREANKNDFLRAIHNALQPWRPRKFSLRGLHYNPDDGFPARFEPALAGCGWVSMLVDNALIHLAEEVRDRVTKIVGCDLNYGATGRPERRAVGEQVFNRLAEIGFRRLPSTTGSSPTDELRHEAEANACKTKMHEHAVLDMIELAISRYNAVSTRRTHGRNGLQYMADLAADDAAGFILPRVPVLPKCVAALDVSVQRASITGNQTKGERPHMNFENAVYTSPELARAWHLIGQDVLVHYHTEDPREVDIFLEDGGFVCTARACGEWAQDPHTLDERRQIAKLVREGKLTKLCGETLPQAFLRCLKQDAIRKSKNGTKVTQAATALAEHSRISANAKVLPPAECTETSSATAPTDHASSVNEPRSKWKYEGPPVLLPTGIRAIG